MSVVGCNRFAGEMPREAPRALPATMAKVARCARLLSGDLEAWQDLETEQALVAGVNTVYAMDIGSGDPQWLYWTDAELGAGAVDVDVARGPIPGDEEERTYLTGLDAPRWTNLAKATTPSAPALHAPYTTHLLGVPAPTVAPTLEVTTDEPEPGEIELTNAGAESGSTAGWTVRSGDLGVHGSSDVPGLAAAEGEYYFYGGNNASGESTQTIVLADTSISANQLLTLKWMQATGAAGSRATMAIEYYDRDGVKLGENALPMEAPASTLTWVERTLSEGVVTPTDTNAIRLCMRFENVGGGETDAYIDDIRLTTTGGGSTWDGSSLSDWVTFTGGGNGRVEIGTDKGRPSPSFKFLSQKETATGIYRDMALTRTSQISIEFDYWSRWAGDDDGVPLAMVIGASSLGEGTGVLFDRGDHYLTTYSEWTSGPITTTRLGGGIAEGKWCHYKFEAEKTGDREFTATFSVVNTETGAVLQVGEVTYPIEGDFLGFKGRNGTNHMGDGWLDNIVVSQTLTVSPSDGSDIFLTNYVFVWVNDGSEVGAPSPVSRSVQLTDRTSVKVTTPTEPPAGYGITKKWIFRAAQTSSGSEYKFVAETPVGQADYVDGKSDADLGDPLESEDFDVPPSDLRGLIALPNGVMAGFRQDKNEFCVSVQNRPHAWPIPWRQSTDFPIVAIQAMDTDVVLATQAHPYIASISDPSAVQMGKLEKGQGCVSKRGMTTWEGVGIVYPSTDGYTAVSRGAIANLTESLLTAEQWKALRPETIHAVVHAGMLFFWYDAGDAQGGYIMSPGASGFGLVRLDFYARAAYVNPMTGRLYLVVGSDLVEWNAAATARPYLWRKLYELDRPTSFEMGQVRVQGGGVLILRLYADGAETPFLERAITNSTEFALPAVECEDVVEIELEGTLRVRSIAIAEVVEELP